MMSRQFKSVTMLAFGVLFFLMSGIIAAPYEGASGNELLGVLQNEVLLLKSEVKLLNKTVIDLEAKMETNLADQYADKTVASIVANKQMEASKFWKELLNHAKQLTNAGESNRVDELLSKIVMNSYSGKRSNFYPLIEFILRNEITSGFPLLYKELVSHNHVFGGQEVFVLGYYLKQTCGTNTQLYKNLPTVVHSIVSGPVIFKNIFNNGYIVASQHHHCKNRNECYGYPKNEAFIHRLSHSLTEGQVTQNPRSHWQFIPPITMDMKNGFNGTRMSWGFHIRNVDEDKYLIVKLRMTSYFLRDNTSFDSYFAGDLQCQFVPTLVDTDEDSDVMMVGLTDKYIFKTEYMYGGKFGKKGEKITIGRRNHHDLEGKLWEIIPVNRANDNDDGGLSNENNLDGSTEHDNSIMSDSKCQF